MSKLLCVCQSERFFFIWDLLDPYHSTFKVVASLGLINKNHIVNNKQNGGEQERSVHLGEVEHSHLKVRSVRHQFIQPNLTTFLGLLTQVSMVERGVVAQ